MGITFYCRGCNQRYEVDPAFTGRQAPCKKCNEIMTIPAVSTGPLVRESASRTPSAHVALPVANVAPSTLVAPVAGMDLRGVDASQLDGVSDLDRQALSADDNPYAPPRSAGGAEEWRDNARSEGADASILARFGAFVLDNLILLVALVLLIVALRRGIPHFDVDPSGVSGSKMLYYALVLGIPILYESLMNSSGVQGTLGKLAHGLKVVDWDGARLSFGRALVRACAKQFQSGFFAIGSSHVVVRN
jgi:uncharacterized RDD family membrane protein YckC